MKNNDYYAKSNRAFDISVEKKTEINEMLINDKKSHTWLNKLTNPITECLLECLS